MKTMISSLRALAAAPGILAAALLSSAQAATYIGSSTYTGYEASSPFFSTFGSLTQLDGVGTPAETTSVYDFRGLSATVGAGGTYFFLEDVQDGQLDVPGVTFTGPIARTGDGINGSNNGGGNTDNVAEDVLRLSSIRTTAGSGGGSGYIRADFTAAALGGELPTFAGIVFAERTTSSIATPSGNGRMLRAYDAGNNLLEEIFVSAASATVADGFLGVSTDTGISYVEIWGDNEYDHFQYGFAVPEPSSALLGSLGALLLLRRRRA